MKKLLLLSALLILACSTDDEGNPCIYEPTLTTQAATDITETSATLNGVISIVSENCDVPNNTEQGFVYSTEIQPTLEDIQVNVNGTNISTTIEGLTPNTTYYVRAFLTNTLGDFYGDEISFMTAEASLVNCDGNPIPSIVYGTQEWTVENACPITYRDGTSIPQVTDNTEWENLTTGAWSYFNNDPTKPRLYNWFAVMGIHDTDPNTPNKEFAPEGWHVPSDAEWTTLEEHLIANGYNYDGTTTENKIGKAMTSTTGWITSAYTGAIGNDQGTNNSSGFNAFPEGYRFDNGSFYIEGSNAIFWSSTEYNTYFAWLRTLGYNGSDLNRSNDDKRNGFSVRFVRD
jgi:uncharacterized protein (TIGR02145 family)|tara:strand:- start:15 stop:1046 length:1032 start_codon:yes stop_codon:yes gene_type:complete